MEATIANVGILITPTDSDTADYSSDKAKMVRRGNYPHSTNDSIALAKS